MLRSACVVSAWVNSRRRASVPFDRRISSGRLALDPAAAERAVRRHLEEIEEIVLKKL